MNASTVLLISCPDRPGIVAAVTAFIAEHGGNILDLDQHTESDAGIFFMRVEWDCSAFDIAPDAMAAAFAPVAERFSMQWEARSRGRPPRIAIFVTREAHCLYDLLARRQAAELPVEIPLIVSNREELRSAADRFGIPFHVFAIAPESKTKQEAAQIELLRAARVDAVVLARYMQIVGPAFVAAFPNRILNIHHSFLPAFPGARPYHSAHQRGVKIIGATSHYVTERLDEGPIIEQDVVRVTHKDAVADLVRKGRDIEKIVLARALRAHIEDRVLVHGNRTIVFA